MVLPICNQSPVFHSANREIWNGNLIHFGECEIDAKVLFKCSQHLYAGFQCKISMLNGIWPDEDSLYEFMIIGQSF